MDISVDLQTAHDEVSAIIQTIPDAALDWQPGNGDWSLRQTIGHLAHANDFYVMIVDEARASGFGSVRLQRDSAGVQRMNATDAQVAACRTVPAAQACFERTFQRMLAALRGITSDELDQPFRFFALRSDVEPVTTTLRQRVIQQAASHLREHQPQLIDTLTHWRETPEI